MMNISSIGYAALGKTPPADASTSRASAETIATKAVSGAARQDAEAEKAASPEDLQQAIGEMNDFVATLNNNSLRFSIDNDTGKTVVKVLDTQTNELIKQIPTEEALAVAKAIDKLKGLLVQQKA
jgi:flagellar protein FlaG